MTVSTETNNHGKTLVPLWGTSKEPLLLVQRVQGGLQLLRLPVAAGLGLGDVGELVQHGRRGRGQDAQPVSHPRLQAVVPVVIGDGNESRWKLFGDELRVPGDQAGHDPEEIIPSEAEGAGLAQDENRLVFGTVEQWIFFSWTWVFASSKDVSSVITFCMSQPTKLLSTVVLMKLMKSL